MYPKLCRHSTDLYFAEMFWFPESIRPFTARDEPVIIPHHRPEVIISRETVKSTRSPDCWGAFNPQFHKTLSSRDYWHLYQWASRGDDVSTQEGVDSGGGHIKGRGGYTPLSTTSSWLYTRTHPYFQNLDPLSILSTICLQSERTGRGI